MKKIIIFLFLFTIFFISLNKQNNNYKYINYDKNIYIEYPNLNNNKLNNNLNKYITSFVNHYDYIFPSLTLLEKNIVLDLIKSSFFIFYYCVLNTYVL